MEGTTNNEQGKKKGQLSISSGRGGGGIAGILVFGGALAVTGVIAVASFASKKNKAKATPHKPKSLPLVEPQESDDTTQGLLSLLQHSTTNHENACYETSHMSMDQINSSQLLSSKTLILEEKVDLKNNKEEESPTSFHQEIVFSDDSPPESAVSSNENVVGEECLASLFDSSCFQAEGVHKSESEEALKSEEIIEAQYEPGTSEIEDDIVEDDDDDATLEIGENSSEATGLTSLDSNEEPVWPAELIEEPQQQFKEGVVDVQSEAEETAKTNIAAHYPDSKVSSGNDKAMTSEETWRKNANLHVMLNDLLLSVSHSSKLSIIPLLLLALLLLLPLLTSRIPESFLRP